MQGTSQLGTECFLLHGDMCRASQTKMNHEQMIFFLLQRALEKNRTAKYQKIFPTGQIEESILGCCSVEDS